MRTRDAVIAGIGAAAGLVVAANGVGSVTYGPQSQDAAKAGENVADVMNRLGAPYATYSVGEQTVYRWGAGRDRSLFLVRTYNHDELLVTADKDGRVISSKFSNKVSGTQVFGFGISDPMP